MTYADRWEKDSGYMALCQELDLADQGETVESAMANLKELSISFSNALTLPKSNAVLTQKVCHPFRSGPCVNFASFSDETCRILEHRFHIVHQHESHIVVQRRTDLGTVTVPIPDHPERKSGTLQSIIRQREIHRTVFEI